MILYKLGVDCVGDEGRVESKVRRFSGDRMMT